MPCRETTCVKEQKHTLLFSKPQKQSLYRDICATVVNLILNCWLDLTHHTA